MANIQIPPALEDNPKGAVYHLAQANGLTPNDVVWEIKATPNGQFVGHVSIPNLGLHQISGTPQQNKKLADRAVAEAARQKVIQALSGQKIPGAVSSVPTVRNQGKPGSAPQLTGPSHIEPGSKWAVRGGKLVQVSGGQAGSQSVSQSIGLPVQKKQKTNSAFEVTGSKGASQSALASLPQFMAAMAAGTKRKLNVPAEPPAKKKKVNSSAAKINKDTSWTKRTGDEKEQARATYEEWRDFRASTGMDPQSTNVTSFDGWYASVCLACLTEVQLINFPSHATGARHAKSYKEIGGLQLHDNIIRPDPHAQVPLHEATRENFASLCGFSNSRVLVLGEQDYSFSLKVAQQQHESGTVSIVATSYLAAHDPSEVEFHAKDDGERTRYSRKSLPSMNGALQQNLDALTELGGEPLHSVDATDLEETFLPQYDVDEQFDVVVFPFPRASLQRGCDPRNSQLLRGYFRSVAETGLLAEHGVVELLMLQNQYAEWDTACMGLEHGFELFSRVALPKGFYQSREMSGKPWTPEGGEMYIFTQQGASES